MAEEAKTAFVTGLHVAAAVGSVLHMALGALALRWIPRSLPERESVNMTMEP
jgi:DHA2 family multidrug resistance protein-like MFS transporter